MKSIELFDYGTPADVCRCIDIEPPGQPAADEVTLSMLACPINPAELLIFEGKYASKPDLPYQPGIEGVGEITAVGESVSGLAVGDRVISLGRQNWLESLNLCLLYTSPSPRDS